MSFSRFAHIGRALQQRDFRYFIAGHLLSQMGMWMQRIVAGWMAWELAHSGTWLGLMGMSDLAPTLFIGALTGALADRMDRLAIVRISQFFNAAFAALICLLYVTGWLTIHLLFACMLIQGIFMAISLPARLAMIPNLIGRENLQAAIAINSLVSNGGRFLGPMVGGFAIVQWGSGWAFAVCAVCFGIPILTQAMIKMPKEVIEPSGKKLMGDTLEGVTYTARHPGIGPVMLSLTITSIFGKPFIQLFPGFSSEVFGRGADGLAWLTSSIGAGALIGGIYTLQRAGIAGLTRIFILMIGFVGMGMVAFSATDIFPLAIIICGGVGASLMTNDVTSQTLLQHAGAANMRGRVSSLLGVVQRGGQAMGSFVLGVTADVIGLRWTVTVGGLVCLAFWLWSQHRSKTIAAALEI
jgi:MFS family permease